MKVPGYFCWSRFGTEAGETIESIVARKEVERGANNGIFLWGIGSAVGPSMRQLLQVTSRPKAIFSPIRTSPREIDVNPGAVVRWVAAKTLEGRDYQLPAASIVTSRAKGGPRKACHYALVCASRESLRFNDECETIALDWVKNLLSGRPVGASQVTAVVRFARTAKSRSVVRYPVTMQFDLVAPYFLVLTQAVPVERRPQSAPESHSKYFGMNREAVY